MSFDSGSMTAEPSRPRRRRRSRRNNIESLLIEYPVDGGDVFEEVGEIGAGETREPEDLDAIVASLSVAEVVELVTSDQADLDAVIAAERRGKARKTVLALVRAEGGAVYPRYSTGQQIVKDSDENPFA